MKPLVLPLIFVGLFTSVSYSVAEGGKQVDQNEEAFFKLLSNPEGEMSIEVRKIGIDPVKLFATCLDSKNKRQQVTAWRLLAWIRGKVNLDGAAGEDYTIIGRRMLQFIDDERLAQIVLKLDTEEVRNLPFAVTWKFGKSEKLFKKYPALAKLVKQEQEWLELREKKRLELLREREQEQK